MEPRMLTKVHQAMLSVIALVATSTLMAAPPRKGEKVEPAPDASIVSPLSVWNDATDEADPSIPAKCLRLAQRVIKKYNRDGSGTLRANEWPPEYGKLADADANHDGAVTVEELAEYLARYARLHPLRKPDTAWQHLPRPPADLFRPVTSSEGDEKATGIENNGTPPHEQAKVAAAPVVSEASASDDKKARKTGGAAQRAAESPKKYYVAPSALPAGLPEWFHELDTDGDGQLTLSEFAPDGSPTRRRLFQRYDENGDGVITPDEVLHFSKAAVETKPASPNAGAGAKK
jgi:hypothetical protein